MLSTLIIRRPGSPSYPTGVCKMAHMQYRVPQMDSRSCNHESDPGRPVLLQKCFTGQTCNGTRWSAFVSPDVCLGVESIGIRPRPMPANKVSFPRHNGNNMGIVFQHVPYSIRLAGFPATTEMSKSRLCDCRRPHRQCHTSNP